VVTDAGNGKFHVIAGGRRLEAIHSLQSEGKLPQDFAVPCQIVKDESAQEMKLDDIRIELEAKGWGWIEINPMRDYEFIHRCTRIRPLLIAVASELLDTKSRLEAELAEIGQMLDETESAESLERQQAIQEQLNEVEQELAAFIGFDAD